jgi:peptide/nickel transport system permease protein
VIVLKRAWSMLGSRGLAGRCSILFLILLILAAFIGPATPWLNPYTIDITDISSSPSWSHLLGTDDSGRDVLARVLVGTRTSLIVGVASGAILVTIATLVGSVAGYFGGIVDAALARTMDALMSIPLLLLTLVFVGVLPPGTLSVILVIGLLGWPSTARIVRAEVLSLTQRPFIAASRLAGLRAPQIIRHHLLPNLAPVLVVAMALSFGNSILLESSLSFLGLGVRPPVASLGSIISLALEPGVFYDAPWIWLPAAGVLAATIVSVNLIADGLRGTINTPAHRLPARGQWFTSRSPRARPTNVMAAQVTADQPAAVVDAREIRVLYRGRQGEQVGVDGVDVNIAPGEILGVVGESGSGKSSLALALAGLLPAGTALTAEQFEIVGRTVPLSQSKADRQARRELLGREIGVVFQDPTTSLDPTMPVGRQITEPLRNHQALSRTELRERLDFLLRRTDLTAIPGIAKRFPHQLSGGQRQRVMIAIAIACNPRILIADEPTTSLDVTVQAKLLDLFSSLRNEFGMSILFVSHDLAVVSQIADRVAVMYDGKVVESGATEDVLAHPQHAYSAALLRSAPRLGQGRGRLGVVAADAGGALGGRGD